MLKGVEVWWRFTVSLKMGQFAVSLGWSYGIREKFYD